MYHYITKSFRLSVNNNSVIVIFNVYVNKFSVDGMTPIQVGAQNGNLDLVKFLCEKGSDLESNSLCKYFTF